MTERGKGETENKDAKKRETKGRRQKPMKMRGKEGERRNKTMETIKGEARRQDDREKKKKDRERR